MENTNNSVEGLFQKTLEGQRISPSPRVLKNIRRQLFIADFFSLNLRKFNIVYVSVIILGVVLVPVLHNQNKKSNLVVKEDHNDLKEGNQILSSETIAPELEPQIEKEEIVKDNNEEAALKAYYIADATKGCSPLNVHFQNKSTNAIKYSWDFGNGDKSNKANPDYQYTKPGKYKVKLVTTGKDGNSDEFEQTVFVYESPESLFEIDVAESDISTKEIAFNNKSRKAVQYKWSFGDNTLSTDKEPEHKYAGYGTYQVSLVSISEKGCSDTLSLTNSFIDKDYRLVFPLKFKPSLTGSNKGAYERPENAAFVFFPENNGVSEYSLAIRASNGMEVFKTSNIKQGWDGYIRGRIAPPGIYKYKAQGVYPNGKKFLVTGNVKLEIDNNYRNFNNN